MPARNSRKDYVPHSYYHVYNRGVEKRLIFYDSQDYDIFLSYLRRHLSLSPESDRAGRNYVLYPSIELLAYCLMSNHFHLLIYVKDEPCQMIKLMQSVCTAYSMYFNKRYKRVGHLFQGRFRAVRVTHEGYLQHISRYIHLNPGQFLSWQWSSLSYYLGDRSDDWVRPARILEMFTGNDYLNFVKDYSGQRAMFQEIKTNLADR